MKVRRVQVPIIRQPKVQVAVAATDEDQARMLKPYLGRVMKILKTHDHADRHQSYLKKAQSLLGTKKMSEEMITLMLST